MLNNEEKNIDFGNKKVKKTEKQTLVNNVFNSVADKYDLMNDLTSLGIHRLWKDSLINWLAPQPYQKLADIAGGTGDISVKFLLAGGCSAHIIDINKEMITKGKFKNSNNNNLSWTIASAENLPMADNSYERASMGFGLRNITNRVLALKEVYRILKPGGRFICLEFSHVENSLLKKIYDVWSFQFMPRIGQKITGDKEAYNYLVESIRQFPSQPELTQMFSEAGFSRVKYRNLSNGIVTLHSGWKL
ncbi:class I SAM-dependent methyltransferase [Alphaproteobacteria bacterium]|jgi:demethylmenaquinone methyltransferase/2-methoxy-6-polyprenyl-1,4-benzoquinol methylase|nr:class I SAM-dependent methyltransferase [Alphaproteobacteria bacterium]MDB2478868.1 class I SAM-dependent methyltransferase [Alphaproteobacteria bacterium]MDC1035999.1 class I SAM-dependent methyltransferase [Alphaproteobacteria bacterium]MDC6452698.1 class I SAM-dependent methyltransferase [Alphaproteobacteria bacterium]